MKKHGFTLIELLAVIVILAIIALIATPMVLNTIDKAKRGSASASAYTYVNGVETSLARYMLNNGGNKYTTGKHTVSELDTDLEISIKGDKPSEGNICIGSNGTVKQASIKINGYVVNYDGKTATTITSDTVEEVTCDGEEEIITPVSKMNLGDYVRMTPTSTSYSISRDLTGYSSDQTINPSELNLWRVIAINEDGTVDVVSEYASSKTVYFTGQKGYLNLIGALNTMAKQYENSEFTVGSRYTGYNGQTEYITDTSKFTYPAPWTTSTTDNSNEVLGGGDVLYKKDLNLLRSVLGTLQTYKAGTTNIAEYWIAGRGYSYLTADSPYYKKGAYVWYSKAAKNHSSSGVGESFSSLYYYQSGWYTGSESLSLRPIVTLKSKVDEEATGSGTSADPWVLV